MGEIDFDITAAREMLRSGRISSYELTSLCLDRANAFQASLKPFIAIDAESALARARKHDEAGRSADGGSLAGIPLAHKDMFYRAGEKSTCGSQILAEFRPAYDSTLISRLDAEGQVVLGTLNMAEFAFGPTGHNEHWGHCGNPWNSDHITGGSSSGSGCAVAARMCLGALGSDTGGSVRLPAGLCGVTGIKPTQTRVSRHGMMPLSFSLDQAGPIAQSARDCALLLRTLAGYDQNDPTSSSLPVPDYVEELTKDPRELSIGIPENFFVGPTDAAILENLDGVIRSFSEIGCKVKVVKWPALPDLSALCNIVLTSEAATIHRDFLAESSSRYQDQVRQRILPGFYYSATKYIDALNMRASTSAAIIDGVFSEVDALLMPLMPVMTPTIDETDIGSGEGESMNVMIELLTRFTRPFNYLGFPGVSFPTGFGNAGLPIACQLIGRPFREDVLLRLVHVYQGLTDWHQRQPNLQ